MDSCLEELKAEAARVRGASPGKIYRRTLEKHLLPAFGDSRLCDIGTLDLRKRPELTVAAKS